MKLFRVQEETTCKDTTGDHEFDRGLPSLLLVQVF